MSIQIPIKFEFQANQSFSTFYVGNNAEIINHLQQISNNREQQIFLWGEKGSGKTHLLQAICQNASNLNKAALYFLLDANAQPDVSFFEDLEYLDIACFDNIEQIAGNIAWEKAFFNFYNSYRDSNKKLVLSASCPPKYLAMQIPDLKTRMSWGLTLKLKSLTAEQQIKALIFKANDLGFEIPVNVGLFLLTHYSSDLPSIWSLLDKIEYTSLATKRKITIPFLKQIMAEHDLL